VEAGFTAGQVSSDGGALLLRETNRRINLLSRLPGCFTGGRSPELIEHPLSEMLSQRIYGLALGYEDLNDHQQLRSDPLLAVLSGKRELDEPLAGKSTLNRLELTGRSGRYHKIGYSAESIDRLLADLYIESHPTPPAEIVLDLDATDIPLHGHQPQRFFHGYYDSYCYLPLLYIFAGDQLLCARLRPANQDAASGSVEEVERIVAQLRERWPGVRIVLRADSGFCQQALKTGHSATLGFWIAAAITSFLFAFLSILPGEPPTAFVSLGLFGMVACFSLWHTGSLWWVIGFHMAWDWTQSFLFGAPDSGERVQHRLLATHPAGIPILSGGATGPECSVFIVPTLAIVVLIILFAVPRARYGEMPDRVASHA
jgi:hypothetical protein